VTDRVTLLFYCIYLRPPPKPPFPKLLPRELPLRELPLLRLGRLLLPLLLRTVPLDVLGR
jgi:hypothetical protein